MVEKTTIVASQPRNVSNEPAQNTKPNKTNVTNKRSNSNSIVIFKRLCHLPLYYTAKSIDVKQKCVATLNIFYVLSS